MNTTELLKKLTSAVGVSGMENNVSALLADMLRQYGEVTVDDMNNVVCTFGKGKHFLLDAHLDEIGFIVKAITNDGFIKVDKCGGIDERMLLASEVSVWGKKEVRGVISNLPPHLQKSGEKKPPKIDEIEIDVGMTKAEAEKVISLGDRVTFKRNFNELVGTQVCSNVLDDRSGVASILLAVEKLKNVDAKITVCFSSQEEVGTRGAKTVAYGKDVDEAIVVDVSFGYTPMCKKSDCGEIGKGVMIGVAPILDSAMSNKMQEIAKTKNIPYQIEVMGGGHTGTNADVITINQCGIKTSLLSIPEKYMHSPIEIVDTKDVEATADLICEYIMERVGDVNA
ncbi:MAG: M20/M25/M40 family metallo-hydrolase [Eubacterium coprostanoligenes]|uniref:M42 family metallopeptidase n=1 Tax=Eubacterium coprostanoligenes TaxID=290054 RepID=UPI00240A74AA|nr:M20/M25/M40 family metallo-hydrolase [Eubacterium coprostanoligenes]MDD6665887.1 M20/M25/M40 family metallo-hydrolase [Eubacterium coprostanoligenes]